MALDDAPGPAGSRRPAGLDRAVWCRLCTQAGEALGMEAGSERRRAPRYPVRYPLDGSSGDRRTGFRGTLCNLSAEGCGLHLDRPLPPGTSLEFRCDINGIGLGLSGQVVWSRAALGGILHGVALTGHHSDQDALFHRLLLGRHSGPQPTQR